MFTCPFGRDRRGRSSGEAGAGETEGAIEAVMRNIKQYKIGAAIETRHIEIVCIYRPSHEKQ